LDLYYEVKHHASALKMYKEIVYIVVAVDYPWPSLEDQLMADLNSRIEAGVILSGQIVSVYEYILGPERQPL
jgi:hypothetical protein